MPQDLKTKFESAAFEIKKLTARPTNDELLDLYAFFKQATDGDVKGDRPGLLDFKGRAKYDAWAKRRRMTSEVAMESYVTLVSQLKDKYSI